MEKIDNNIQRSDIKQIVMSVLTNQSITASKLILFGSRARNDFKKDSDWDLLLILENETSREEKIEISYQIRRALAKRHIASDVIIRSQSEIQKFTKRVNSLTKTAIEEGVPL